MFVSLHSTSRAFRALTLVGGILVAESSTFAQTAPIGWVDVADWHHIAGWAADADISPSYNYPSSCGVQSTGGIVVHAYVWPIDENNNITGSARVFGAMSNQCRCDVPCHGFDIALPTGPDKLAPGRYTTSVYALGVNSSVPGSGQYGHPGNLDGNNALLSGNPKIFEVPTKTLTYSQGFTCDVFGASTKTAMSTDFHRIAYDFSVTKLSASSYLSVFHAERYETNGGDVCTGDSISARYASTPDGPFGQRTGIEDKIITTTAPPSPGLPPSPYMWNDPSEHGLACQNNFSGGGNPILVYTGTPGDPNLASQWSVLWLSVAELTAGVSAHYLHLGNLYDINNIISAYWTVLAENGGFPWAQFYGAPVYRNYYPTPVRDYTNQAHVKSEHDATTGGTQGLIGNISRDATGNKAYFFYLDLQPQATVGCSNDYVPEGFAGYCQVTMRREMLTPTTPNWFSPPVRVMWGWAIKVAYHPDRGRWMVLHQCPGGQCLQFAGPEVGSVADTAHGGALVMMAAAATSFDIGYTTPANPTNSQWGILKNNYGQVAGDDFRVYFRPGPEGNNNVPGGTQIRSMRIKCQ